jgi:streptogramin lyase
MKKVRIPLMIVLAIGLGTLGVMHVAAQKSAKAASNQSDILLSGTVRSSGGHVEEGISVSAKAEGSTMSTSVFTDADGLYIFPPMPKGKYHVWAQTVGLATGNADVTLEGSKSVRQDFSLQPVADVARQMTGADWFNSMPEDNDHDRRVKDLLYTNCSGCHGTDYPLQNRFDKNGWVAMMDLMKMLSVVGTRTQKEPYPIMQYHEQELAEYLATKVHGPDVAAPAKLNIVSRPKGDATLTVVTEYAVEPGETPGELPIQDGSDWSKGVPSSLNGVRGTHDVEIDNAGNLWFVDSQPNPTRTYARIDAKTGEVTNFKVLSSDGKVRTSHGMRKDSHGIIWFNVAARGDGSLERGYAGRGGLGRLDPVTMKFDLYTPNQGTSGIGGSIDIDGKGKIWASADDGAVQFDPDTQKFTGFKSTTMRVAKGGDCTGTSCGTTYGVGADSEGNGYWAQMGLDIVDKGDITTGKVVEIKMPPRLEKMELVTPEERALYDKYGSDWNSAIPYSQGPRRLAGDHRSDSVWVADSWGDNLAKIDIHTNKVTMYPIPTKYSVVYSTVVDKNHNVWANTMNNDSVFKFDPTTGKWSEYMLPSHGAESRHIAINEQGNSIEVAIPYSRTAKVALMRFRTKQDLQALKDRLKAGGLQAENR